MVLMQMVISLMLTSVDDGRHRGDGEMVMKAVFIMLMMTIMTTMMTEETVLVMSKSMWMMSSPRSVCMPQLQQS